MEKQSTSPIVKWLIFGGFLFMLMIAAAWFYTGLPASSQENPHNQQDTNTTVGSNDDYWMDDSDLPELGYKTDNQGESGTNKYHSSVSDETSPASKSYDDASSDSMYMEDYATTYQQQQNNKTDENKNSLEYRTTRIKNELAQKLAYENAFYIKEAPSVSQGTSIYIPANFANNGIKLGVRFPAFSQIKFGDGTAKILDTRTERSATIYKKFQTGKYSVIIDSEDLMGRKIQIMKLLVIKDMELDYELKEKLLIERTESNFTAIAESFFGNITQYKWTCEGINGQKCFEPIITEKEHIKLIFPNPGDFKLSLTAKDKKGSEKTISKEIRVLMNSPQARFTIESMEKNKTNPKNFKFDANRSRDIFGTSADLEYFWDFNGNIVAKESAVSIYQFNTPGEKTIKLIVGQTIDGQTIVSPIYERKISILP